MAYLDQTANKREITVLRPISTTDLSTADVGTLATRVRDQMLDTIRDLFAKLDSEQPEDSHQKEESASRDSGPIESTMSTTLSPGIGIDLESLETIPDITGSSSSLASSASSHQRTRDANETGAETEEDDGMILVGRPQNP
jgi:lysophosphatidate acyltransferase